MLDTVLEPRSAAYVAGPLASGRLHHADRSTLVRPDLDLRAVNAQRLSAFAMNLRRRLDCPVIDPGILNVPGWSADHYLDLLSEVLRRYVREAWFIDDWQYSDGATAEYVLCLQIGTPCLTQMGEDLPVDSGHRLIRHAADDFAARGLDDTRLRSRLASLVKVTSRLRAPQASLSTATP